MLQSSFCQPALRVLCRQHCFTGHRRHIHWRHRSRSLPPALGDGVSPGLMCRGVHLRDWTTPGGGHDSGLALDSVQTLFVRTGKPRSMWRGPNHFDNQTMPAARCQGGTCASLERNDVKGRKGGEIKKLEAKRVPPHLQSMACQSGMVTWCHQERKLVHDKLSQSWLIDARSSL